MPSVHPPEGTILVRGFFHEGGANAGACEHYGDSVVLIGFSLSDQGDNRPLLNDQARRGLAGIGVVFAKLLEGHNDPEIRGGSATIPVIGNRLAFDQTASSYFKKYARQAAVLGAQIPGPHEALAKLHEAVRRASSAGLSGEVFALVGDLGRLTFRQLEN